MTSSAESGAARVVAVDPFRGTVPLAAERARVSVLDSINHAFDGDFGGGIILLVNNIHSDKCVFPFYSCLEAAD